MDFNIVMPRNTRHRKRINGDEFRRPKPLPKTYEKNPLWRRILDFDEFKEIFPPFLHEPFDGGMDDWAIYVHVLDSAFSIGSYATMLDEMYRLIKEDVKMENKLLNEFIDEKGGYKTFTFFKMVHVMKELFGIKVTYDLDTLEVEFTVMDEEIVQATFEKLTVDILKKFLKAKMLPVTGTKSALVERIGDGGYSIVDVAEFIKG